MNKEADTRRTGVIAGVTAYALWGLFPLYWPLLKPAGALEILAHRIIWSFVFVTILLLVLRVSWRWVAGVFQPRNLMRLGAASGLIAVNWLTYIFAVNAGFVVEASLGYFINPLANVLFGVLLFGERLGRVGKIGAMLATVGVVVIAWGNWQTLWVSLVLAVSFGLYGVAKKRAHLPALQGLMVESGFLMIPSLAYVGFLAWTGSGQFATSISADLLMILSGPITAIPLWLFAIAAPRLPLGVTGVLQYLAPTIQFLLGLFVFGQHVTASYWAGLTLVWLGSAAYLSEALSRRPTPIDHSRADAPPPAGAAG